MQEYVKISSDQETTELLRQVSEAIESAISESANYSELKKRLDTILSNQNKFPNSIETLNEELVKVSSKVEEAAENKVSQIISKNEINRNIIVEQIGTLSEKFNKQNNILSNVHLLQKEIGENSKPIAEIKERIKLNYDDLSENLHKAIGIGNNSSQILDKISKDLFDMKEQVKRDSEQIRSSIKTIIDKQDILIDRIKTVENIQREPWYKKIFK